MTRVTTTTILDDDHVVTHPETPMELQFPHDGHTWIVDCPSPTHLALAAAYKACREAFSEACDNPMAQPDAATFAPLQADLNKVVLTTVEEIRRLLAIIETAVKAEAPMPWEDALRVEVIGDELRRMGPAVAKMFSADARTLVAGRVAAQVAYLGDLIEMSAPLVCD